MSYKRVIPRDFFNEAKLLKCYGQFALFVHNCEGILPNNIQVEINDNGEPFSIIFDEAYGLTVENYPISINGQEILFFTNYNSKEPYPFYCVKDAEILEVFDDSGLLMPQFLEAFAKN